MDMRMQFVIVNRRMQELRGEAEADRLGKASRLSRIDRIVTGKPSDEITDRDERSVMPLRPAA